MKKSDLRWHQAVSAQRWARIALEVCAHDHPKRAALRRWELAAKLLASLEYLCTPDGRVLADEGVLDNRRAIGHLTVWDLLVNAQMAVHELADDADFSAATYWVTPWLRDGLRDGLARYFKRAPNTEREILAEVQRYRAEGKRWPPPDDEE